MKTAIILAAGQGRKFWPYSVTRNKAAIPVANRPVIKWMVEALKACGIKNIFVVTGYRKEQIMHTLSKEPNVTFVDQKGEKGTIPAALSTWDTAQEESVLVCYGDVLVTHEDLQRLIQAHNTSKSIASVLLKPLNGERPCDWLCAGVRGEKVTHVLGHPRDDVSHRFCGVFALDGKFAPYLKNNPGRMEAVQVAMMPPDEAHIEDSLQMAIDANEEILAVEAKDIYFDIDKPWHLLEANAKWLTYHCAKIIKNKIGKNSKISERAYVNGNIVIGENSEIGDGVIIEGNILVGNHTKIIQGAIVEGDVSIGSQCLVRRYSQVEKGSSIGNRCVVGHGAEVSGILMQNSFAYHYGEFWGVIGEAGDLGAATVCGNLRFDDDQTIHKINGRREFPEYGANAAYLGDYVRTGVNAVIMPGVKIGPYSVIGAGTIVHEDVPENTLLYVKQEQIRKAWGPERYGW